MTAAGLAKLAVALGTKASAGQKTTANPQLNKNIGYQLLLVGIGCLSDALNADRLDVDADPAPKVALGGWTFHIQLPTAPTACVP